MPQNGQSLGNRAAPARVAATVTTLFGLVALAGWIFHLPLLTRLLPGAVEMKVNTAVAVILSGAALLIFADRAAVSAERIARSFALAVVAIGLASLAEYVFGWQLGIDEFLVKDTEVAYNPFRGRMSPISAAAFVIIGSALAAMHRPSWLKAAKSAAGLVILIGAVSIIGYLWSAGELITDTWVPPVAINTAICFVLLGAGVLLSPDRSRLGLDTELTALATVEIKILSGFLLAMSLLLFGSTYTYRTSVELADSAEWVAHTQEVRATIADLYGSLAGAELAQRDYLLTTQHTRLDEYARLVDVVRYRLAELGRLTSDNAAQQTDWAALKAVVKGRLDDMAGTLAAYQTYGLPAARALLGQGRLGSGIEDVRIITERMDAVEARLLAERQTAAGNIRRTTLISLLITLAVASAIFIVLFRGIHREMRARRDAQHALRDSEQYNRSIVDSSPDCLAILTPDARLSQMTPQGLRLMEVEDFGSIANTDWFAFWSGEDQAAARRAVADALGGSAGRFHGQCPTQAGTPKWWDVIVMPIRSGDGKTDRLLSVSRDITEVKRAETNLTTANRFLDSLIEMLPVMIFVKDARTLRYVRQNRATLNLLGLSKDEVIGKRDRDFLPAEQADSILAKDREVLAAGRLVDIPEQSIHTQLLGVRTLHTMKMPLLDEHGTPEFLLGVSEDITERKLAEHAIRELNAALLTKASQLEATNKELESFSYSVSHDLRAPLRAVDGFALMLEEDYKERLDAEGLRYLSVIRQNSRRMGALIDDLLAFSRLGRQSVAHDQVNVDSLVREVVEEVLHTQSLGDAGEGATAPHIEVQPLPPARGDRGLLRQVWVNLIANAVKYSSKAARPFIQVSGREVGAENHYCVRDNGVGFDMDYAGQLFRVFQRLHRADEFSGTGVGLAIVHRVVTRHGGRVWAEGKVDNGAVFSFALPRGDRSG
jgi:PAS domain S-box-containing protein